ncbi:ParB/RepB/Spo0J family partition protein [Arthrobacter crusticola]|uniref:ParB/RepB/Spo0J family partition protein n=1 Tax=Arthrobacter crusticola TaxID=2547960 RepID=UPI00319DBA15
MADASPAPSSAARSTGAKGRKKAASASEGPAVADAPAAWPEPEQAPAPAAVRGEAGPAADVPDAGIAPQKAEAGVQGPGETAQSPAGTESVAVVVERAAVEEREAPVQAEEPTGTGKPDTAAAAGDAEPAPADGVDGDAGGLLEVPGARFAELPLDAIHPNRKQPRSVFDADDMAELVHSIREIGVLQPIVVRPSSEKGDAPYELVMGERRWRATREAGLERVPAIIRSTADDDLLRDALLENLHRSSLNPLEEAAAYQQLLDDFGCSHEELAERIGRSRPQISNTLRLMKLPPLVQRRVAAGVLSAGHARALLGLADQADMEKLAQRIVAEGLSVRSTEEIVAMSDGLRRQAKPTAPRNAARHERLDYLATSLSDRLDTSVKITLGARKGKVSIEFASVDDLNRIMTVLAPPAG